MPNLGALLCSQRGPANRAGGADRPPARALEAPVRGTRIVARHRRFIVPAAIAAACAAFGLLLVLGFIEGREEAAVEGERGQPIKPPLRVTVPKRGEPIVTIDTDAQKAIGFELETPKSA